MYKVSSGTLSLTHHRYNNCLIEGVTQYFVTARLLLRERQIFVTLRVTQYVVTGKIYTLVRGCQTHTIQIVRAHARDLTMGAARTGLAPGIIFMCCHVYGENEAMCYIAIL